MTILENVPLSLHTTLRIGGKARFFVSVETKEDLHSAISFARERSLPFAPLGEGSNVLARDEGFEGVVLKMAMKGIEVTDGEGDVVVTAMAGERWDDVVAFSVESGWWGVENLSGIPGLLGAAPIQNIGAYGSEIKDVLSFVDVLDSARGEEKRLTSEECEFSYRHSIFKTEKGKDFIVTRVGLRLRKEAVPNISYKDLEEKFAHREPSLKEMRQAILSIRARKFPDLAVAGTAGSFFKNPIVPEERAAALLKSFPQLPHFPSRGGVKLSLAWILDHICGLRGTRGRKVGLFENQPLVLVTERGATQKEVEIFAEDIARIVKEKTGIVIEREVVSLP